MTSIDLRSLFQQLQSVFQQNRYVFIIMGLVIIGTMVFNVVRLRKMKGSNQNFLASHPDAAKIYLTVKALITSEVVTVYGVDGEGPQFFAEGAKSGFYVIPGSRTVEMSYTHSRPGVLHKNVTQTYGPVKKELVVEANKTYLLGFDRDQETFTFEET
jgi:hypothetical protein